GGIYGLLAVGLVLAYSTSGVFNFGHGAIAFAAAFTYFQLTTGFGWPIWLAATFVILVMGPLVGMTWNRLVFHKLADEPEAVKIVASVGVMIVTPALVLGLFHILDTVFSMSVADTTQAFA